MDQLNEEQRKTVSQQGGKARAKRLSPKRRSEIARKAALKRWRKRR